MDRFNQSGFKGKEMEKSQRTGKAFVTSRKKKYQGANQRFALYQIILLKKKMMIMTMSLTSMLLLFALLGEVKAQESNTECDTGPNALNNVFGSAPQTCFDFLDDERCIYTFVPPCAIGKNVPLVLDIHGYSR